MCLVADKLFAPEEVPGPVGVVLAGGKIIAIERNPATMPAGADLVDLRPWSLAPGLVDLHTHGFGGYDVTSGSEADVLAMARALPSTGVTALYPTIASSPAPQTRRQVGRVARAITRRVRTSAEILGIRLEGPYISRDKRGAQYAPAIRPPDADELLLLASEGPIAMVDFAPEQDSDARLQVAMSRLGIIPSVAHTSATYAQTLAALDAGARHCAHLFNAMPPFEHRAPGAVGALLTDARPSVEVIADGVHVHPAMLRLAVASRGPRQVALVTDGMSAAGQGDGHYTFLERDVVVADGAARLADGTLAGSILTLDAAVRNMVQLAGVSWSDAIRMATLTPASIAGVAHRKGRLGPGADADLVVIDQHGLIQQTWIAGQCVFAGPH
ncbi:MAG: N-acetylglucosamine-6-phosphate deacetylase [Chloroflexi bacterium]|nr:N-acetylglucosamine-6-phosphate deacetylase [Chloroflexota bacterium]